MTARMCVVRLVACGVLNTLLAANVAAADGADTIVAPTSTADRGTETVVRCDPLPPLNIG